MIVIDASALIAIMQNEPEADEFLMIIAREDRVLAPAVTMLEAGIVMRARRGPEGLANLVAFVEAAGIEVIPLDASQITAALDAFSRFGKGIHPQARLNLGDCASYALVQALNAPLLFKGNDFAATDIIAAA